MKGTFKIRNKEGQCLCALFTEDYIFYNALMDEKSKEFFNDVESGVITVSDLNTNKKINAVPEYYLISLDVALSCKDFREFLFNCKEVPYGCKKENGNG